MLSSSSSSILGFIEAYRKAKPNDVFVVDDEVDINYEPTAYYQLLKEKNPLIWFHNIRGFKDYSLVTNVLGSEERMAFALGSTKESLYDSWQQVITHSGNVALSSRANAPIKERIFKGDDVDLFSLPAPRHFASDGSNTGNGRYITAGLAVSRDPLFLDTINMTFTRIQIVGKTKYAFDMGSRSHFWRYVQSAKEAGQKRLPISVIIGAHPVYYMLAASFIENEYKRASKVINAEYVLGETNDIPIPAESEIVVEADVLLDESFDEGPFSEFTGYMATRSTGNVAEVKSILKKEKAIYYDISPSNSNEHVGLFSIPRNAAILHTIREFMPAVRNYMVEWPKSASHFMALCSIDKPEPGVAKQMGLALLALDPLFSKIVIVNDGFERELSLERLLCNLAVTGATKGINVDIISDVFCIKLDPSADPRGTNGKMIITTKSCGIPYTKKVESKDAVSLTVGDSKVIFSHREDAGSGNVRVILDQDIDLSKPDQVVWALATRLRPDKGVSFGDSGKITFRATMEGLQIPLLPEQVVSSVGQKMKSRL